MIPFIFLYVLYSFLVLMIYPDIFGVNLKKMSLKKRILAIILSGIFVNIMNIVIKIVDYTEKNDILKKVSEWFYKKEK